MDRVHRVGQTRQVVETVSIAVKVKVYNQVRVVRFVTKDTVEEKVLRLQRRKQLMIKSAMQSSITIEDIKLLFADV
eukprot:103166-Hanusia_phi.AAC.1